MKYLLATALLLLSFSDLIAQPGPGGNRGGGGPQIAGRLYGKIIETSSGKPVEYASVQLLQQKMDTVTKQRKETVIGGMLTKSNGDFSIENVPVFGPLKLKVTGIGFKEFTQNISFELKRGGDPSSMLNALDKDLGNIRIEIEEKVLGNVTVSSEKAGLQLGIDRKIFNVDKNIVSAGGTAVDIMRNVPSLNVDIDGNVTLRNNTPQLFVDGRPTNLTLEQIPADAIQTVELITNPSAKFDASGGTAGILNIVLKKEKKVGYNGNLRANVDSRGRVGAGGDINLRQQKVNFFVSGMYNQRKSIGSGTTTRENLTGSPLTALYQSDSSIGRGAFGFGRAGVDYFISNRNTLSASINYARGSFRPYMTSDILIDSLFTPDKTSSFNERIASNRGNFRNLGSTISFKHNFPRAGREWTADATYNRSKNANNNFITTNYLTVPQYQFIRDYKQQQRINGENENFVVQTDFVNPLNEKSKVEFGARAQLRATKSANAFYEEVNGQWVLQPASQADYESNDQVYAAYATYSSQLKNFGYQLGLRAESSDYEGILLKTGELFNIDFPISFFPSVFLSQKLGDDQSLQLNYSRRINRPNFWQLTPFTDSSDKLNPRKGNPGLSPEFTNSLELSYEKTFKNKDNFLASVYYKHTTDLITSYQVAETISNEDIILNTFINANSSYVTGLELISRNKLTKWWEITSNLNLYTSDIRIDDPGQPEQERLTSWFGKLNNNFKLPHNITIQVSGDYQSKTILPPGGSGGGGRGFGGGPMFGGPASASQGYVRPNYGVDIALRYEFLKNRTAALSLNMNDIFRTRRQDIHSESAFFIQDVFRRRDPQVLRINFNWRFGKFDPNLFKRKNTRAEQNSGEGMNMGQ